MDSTRSSTRRLADLLKDLPYFEQLPAPALEQLAGYALQRSYAPGAVIFTEGEASAGLWLIEEGHVKIYKLAPDGREHVLRWFGPGATFNEAAALDRGPYVAHAAAVDQVLAWVIPTDQLLSQVSADPAMALALIHGLAQRLRQLVLQVEDLALRSVTARLARFILEQAEDPALTAPAVTRALIAAHLATTPETISRALRGLEQAGAIRFDRHRIVIEKAGLLRELAQV
jgi:CRP/FNR family transcriptional regulator